MNSFDNHQEANLKACIDMVESVLSGMGHDPIASRQAMETGPAWGLKAGSAAVFIYVTPSPQEPGVNTIQIVSAVMRPPEDSKALYAHLLDLNASQLTGAAFGVRDGAVVVSTDRSTKGLDAVEIEDMVRRVSEYADYFDDILTVEYGGTRYSDG